MPVNFFSVPPCANPVGNCQTEVVHCLQPITSNRFGISDANANHRLPAKVMLHDESSWDFTIENNDKAVYFKAIDYCIEIYRTGTYDVYDDESDINNFSSDNTNAIDMGLIKRCEGLIRNEDFILFFEIKNRPKGDWLIDARRKFEETILSFKAHHPHLSHLIIEPIVSNKSFHRVHQTEMIQKRILKDKLGVALKVQTNFSAF
jgi:hypothetical protein